MIYSYDQEFLNSGFSYRIYRELLNDMLTRPAQWGTSEIMRQYTIDNVALMDKYDRNCLVTPDLKATLETAPSTTWLVITEGWCGDAAFNLPVLAALEQAVPDKVKICIFLRDSNPALMDANLTDGGRSIPKLIVLSKDFKVLGQWGPRPAGLQALMQGWKSQGMILNNLIYSVNEWYDADNTASIQQELKALVQSYC